MNEHDHGNFMEGHRVIGGGSSGISEGHRDDRRPGI